MKNILMLFLALIMSFSVMAQQRRVTGVVSGYLKKTRNRYAKP